LSRAIPARVTGLLIAAVLLVPSLASGAEGTYTPPMLRGDLDIGYQGGLALVQLEDRSSDDGLYTEVASYAEQHHGLRLGGAFSPYHGIAISLDLAIVFHRQLSWSSGRDFRYDPLTDRPTMSGGAPLDTATLDASAASERRLGFGDIGLGFRIVPFAQEGLPNRTAPISLAFDVGLRFPSGQHRYKIRDDGSRFPGRGGMGITVGTTASRMIGPTEPYLSIHYSHNAPYSISDEEPPAATTETTEPQGPKAADRFQLRFGAMITAFRDVEKGRTVALDLAINTSYIGPEHGVAGLQLPTILADTAGSDSVISEHAEVGVDLGLAMSPRPEIEIRLDFGSAWISAHSVERITDNAYSVRTRNGSLKLHWGAGVRIHFR